MHFSDIFKQSFLREFQNDYSTATLLFFLLMSALLGLYIFMVYRLATRRAFYNRSFNLSLWVLSVITAAIIITISTNVIVSLGMVGALSIVRYRTAIKDPMDLVFLFWSIATGIICGAGMASMAIMLALVVTAGIFLLNFLPRPQTTRVLTVSATATAGEAIFEQVKAHTKRNTVKSRSLSKGQLSLVIEYTAADDEALLNAVSAVEGVSQVATMQHTGDVIY